MAVDFASRGIEPFYALQPGEVYAWFQRKGGPRMLIIAHPDREPKVVYLDGREEILRSYPSEE